MLFQILAFLSLLPFLATAEPKITSLCPCGWRLNDSGDRYTHRIYNDFSTYLDVEDVLKESRANRLASQWLVNGYLRHAQNPSFSLDQQFAPRNVQLKGGALVMKQVAYTAIDEKIRTPVSVAGIQSRELDILHGSFRTTIKVEGANGGAVSSFFWYHSDVSEVDIEYVTQGTSLVNNTINYTSHPSIFPNGTPIPNATRSVLLPKLESNGDYLATFHEHRFDCDLALGVRFYLDGQLMHSDLKHIPKEGGTLQLNLWADGNKWWSGQPSKTDVFMTVKQIVAFFNTSGTSAGTDKTWFNRCEKAGGPSEKTVCVEGAYEDVNDMDEVGDRGIEARQILFPLGSIFSGALGLATSMKNQTTMSQSGVEGIQALLDGTMRILVPVVVVIAFWHTR